MINDAHARGLKVIPWTVDDPATMESLIDLGVDGIITNYPNVLRRIMADRECVAEGLPGGVIKHDVCR
jgi:glycerophosphoryl diester phosphodiesterase